MLLFLLVSCAYEPAPVDELGALFDRWWGVYDAPILVPDGTCAIMHEEGTAYVDIPDLCTECGPYDWRYHGGGRLQIVGWGNIYLGHVSDDLWTATIRSRWFDGAVLLAPCEDPP